MHALQRTAHEAVNGGIDDDRRTRRGAGRPDERLHGGDRAGGGREPGIDLVEREVFAVRRRGRCRQCVQEALELVGGLDLEGEGQAEAVMRPLGVGREGS